MPRPSREALPASAQRIANAFEDAKRNVWEAEGRRLTQSEFAANALPPAKSGKPQSARYLRLLLEGKRSGSLLETRASQTKLINVEVQSPSGDVRSITMRIPKGQSTLDIYRSNVRSNVIKAEEAWRKRYDEYTGQGKIVKVRSVQHTNVQPKIYQVAS